MSWRDLEDEMSDICSEEFAERVVHIPRRAVVNARAELDPDRAPYETHAIFEWQAASVWIGKGRDKTASPPATFHNTREPTFFFDKRDLVHEVIEGDLLGLPEQSNQLFEARGPQPDGQGRIRVPVTRYAGPVTFILDGQAVTWGQT